MRGRRALPAPCVRHRECLALCPECVTLLATSLTLPAQRGLPSPPAFTSVAPQPHGPSPLPGAPGVALVPLPTALGVPT